MYPSPTFDQTRTAITDFSVYSRDPKAGILPSYTSYAGDRFVAQVFFYDAPTPPGIFNNFTNIATISSDLKTRLYLDVILSSGEFCGWSPVK